MRWRMELVAGCYEQVLLGFATRPGQVTGAGGTGRWGKGRSTERSGWEGTSEAISFQPLAAGRDICHETSVFGAPSSPVSDASGEVCGGNAPPAPLETRPGTHRLTRPQPRFREPPGLLKLVAGAGRPLRGLCRQTRPPRWPEGLPAATAEPRACGVRGARPLLPARCGGWMGSGLGAGGRRVSSLP